MNILLTSYYFNPSIGGIQSLSELLAEEFCRRGNSVLVVTQTEAAQNVTANDAAYKVLRQPSWTELIRAYAWADVVLQNHISIRLLWPILVIQKPLVIGLQTWLSPRRMWAYRFFMSRATKLVACSNALGNEYNFIDSVIWNAYDDSVFKMTSRVERQNKIVFVGRLVEDKGVDLLIQAFLELDPEWTLEFVGLGPCENDLREIVKLNRMENKIIFRGLMRGTELVEHLNQCEIMVVPSVWREPFGIVALEGLACGCALLVADGGGLPEAVGLAGFTFKRGSIGDLKDQLSTLIANPDLRFALKNQAIRHLETFKTQIVSQKYLNEITKAVQGNYHRSLP